MDMYTSPEQRNTETYMIPGSALNPPLAYLPQLGEVDYMGNEVTPEFIFNQGLYYPAANYYGYYCTGFESPSEWDDHNSFFGLDGQDLHYSGLQTESLPYLYYAPSYGYAQSLYNPYNPYIPGAVMGLDGLYIGTDQYVTNPTCQLQVASPAYIPVVQPSIEAAPNSTHETTLSATGASAASIPVLGGVKYTPLASTNTSDSQRVASVNPPPETSQSSQSIPKSSEGSQVNAPVSKQSLTQGVPVGSATQVPQVRSFSGSAQATHQISHGRVPSIQNPLKVTVSLNDGYSHFGSNVRGWSTADKFRPRLQFNEVLSNPTGGTDVLGEQNKGPRTSGSRSQWVSSVDVVQSIKSDATSRKRSIIIDVDQYNRDDFQVDYPIAKFFVIKSYSEDDVHKSIKYNVWSSTPSGNKRLQSAYEDAQKLSIGQPMNCPIFLFFSVNASGQFCGVAEMIGPVDFNKDMDFWQQDKWTGSFPVKWHMIKDVANTSFRHVILANNENKPVTNSRDTQEIPYLPGINMISIFKSIPLKTSILDDFKFYEDRERIMQEEKARLFRRSYDASQFLPAIFPVKKSNSTVTQTLKADEEQLNDKDNGPLKADEEQPIYNKDQPLKGGERKSNGVANQSEKEYVKPSNGTVEISTGSKGKPHNSAVRQPLKEDKKPLNGAVHPPKANTKQPIHAVDQLPKADETPVNGSAGQLPKADRTQNNLRGPIATGGQPLKADRNGIKLKDPKSTTDQHPKADRKDLRSNTNILLEADRKDPKHAGVLSQREDRNPSNSRDPKAMGRLGPGNEQVTQQKDSVQLSRNKNAKHGLKVTDTALEFKGEASSAEAVVTDIVTVGSMRIKVKGPVDTSPSSITVGSIPIKSKGLQVEKQGGSGGSHPHIK